MHSFFKKLLCTYCTSSVSYKGCCVAGEGWERNWRGKNVQCLLTKQRNYAGKRESKEQRWGREWCMENKLAPFQMWHLFQTGTCFTWTSFLCCLFYTDEGMWVEDFLSTFDGQMQTWSIQCSGGCMLLSPSAAGIKEKEVVREVSFVFHIFSKLYKSSTTR